MWGSSSCTFSMNKMHFICFILQRSTKAGYANIDTFLMVLMPVLRATVGWSIIYLYTKAYGGLTEKNNVVGIVNR